MTESIETPRAPAPPSPETGDERPEVARPSISYGRAMVAMTIVFAVSALGGQLDHPAIAPALVCAVAICFAAWAALRGVLRAQPLVMAGVTWLVLSVILKLVFLEVLPAAPLAVIATILFVQYLAQLGVDLRAFANAGDTTPPVTYPVTFALVPVLAVGAELFRAARMNFPYAVGVALAMVLASSFFLLLVVWWDWTRKAFSSLKMAVTLLSLIGVGSIVGTFVIQHTPGETDAAHYDKFMNGEGAAPVNARYLFQDPQIEWTAADDARQSAMNDEFGPGQGDRWAKMIRHERVKKAKEAEGRVWVAENRDGLHRFYEVCETAEATRIFKSWYFNALLVLLAGTVVGVMVRRFPYERRDAGWVAAHSGIVFLLLCLAGSDLSVRDGFILLAPTAEPGSSGEPTETRSFDDVFAKGASGGPSRDFPWTLRLVRTSADWYQELVVEMRGEGDRVTANQSYPVLAGKVIELERPSKDAPPRYRIEIVDVLGRCRPTRVGFRQGTTSGITALQLVVQDAGRTSDRWITDDDAPLALPGGQLRFVAAATEADVEKWLGARLAPGAGTIGFIRVNHGDDVVARVPATLGQKTDIAVGGRTWHATVTDVFLDASKATAESAASPGDRTPVEQQFLNVGFAAMSMDADGAPPLRARAFGPGADESVAQLANPVLKDAGLEFHLDVVPPREVRIVALPDASLVVVEETRAGVSAPRTLKEHDAMPVGGGATPAVTIGAFVTNAELDVDVAPLPAETDAEYMKNGLGGTNEQIGNPAVRVRVTEPGAAPYEQWILGGDPWVKTPVMETRDRRVRMVLTSTSESMFRSAVQAIDAKGNVLGEHVVRVNDPFRMDGYEFYQNNFVRPDQDGPLSTFRVKYDPFVPFLYAGFVLVAAGVITMLWFPSQRAFKLHAHLARLPEERP
jgi:hypothetical protein